MHLDMSSLAEPVWLRPAVALTDVVGEKMQPWIDNGAQLAWLIDPIHASVSVYPANAISIIMARPETINAAHPVAGFSRHLTAMAEAVGQERD